MQENKSVTTLCKFIEVRDLGGRRGGEFAYCGLKNEGAADRTCVGAIVCSTGHGAPDCWIDENKILACDFRKPRVKKSF